MYKDPLVYIHTHTHPRMYIYNDHTARYSSLKKRIIRRSTQNHALFERVYYIRLYYYAVLSPLRGKIQFSPDWRASAHVVGVFYDGPQQQRLLRRALACRRAVYLGCAISPSLYTYTCVRLFSRAMGVVIKKVQEAI